MAVYLVTGKLGSGKSLATVSKIRDYLNQGRPVATNLDLYLENIINPWAKQTRAIRLPDKPTVDDLIALPAPYEGEYSEDKAGLIVLDECGTWFNTRQYSDKSRQPLIDKLLHIRKAGWDVMFIIQHPDMIDKQIREGLGEHVVVCQRADRLGIPFITAIGKILHLNIRPPKMHLAIVKYGTSQSSPVVDRWVYNGSDLYKGYDTRQVFGANNCGIHSYLPPFFTYGQLISRKQYAREQTKKTFSKLSNFAIRAKRSFFLIGLVIGLTGNFFTGKQPSEAVAQSVDSKPEVKEETNEEQHKENPLDYIRITASQKTSKGIEYYFFDEFNGSSFEPSDHDYKVRAIDLCRAIFISMNSSQEIRCKSKTPVASADT